jgi:hypothetical protein
MDTVLTPLLVCRLVCARGITLQISAQNRSGLPVYSDAPKGFALSAHLRNAFIASRRGKRGGHLLSGVPVGLHVCVRGYGIPPSQE